MRKVFKIILGVLAVGITLILSLFLILNLVDWNKHKDFIKGTVARYSSIRIDELDGIDVKLWRSMELGVNQLKLHIEGEDAALKSFSTGPARLRIATWPLLFKDQLLIQSFTMDEARLRLKEVREKAAEQPAEEGKTPAEILAELPRIFINLAAISAAEIHYDSLEKKEPLQISIEKFQVEAPKDDPVPKLSGQGRIGEFSWKLAGETGTLEAFQNQDKPFPLRLQAEMGQQDLDLNGAVVFADSTGDFTVKAKGPNLEQIKKLLNLNIGPVPAYNLAFAVRLEPELFKFEKIDLKLGASQLNGNLQVDLRQRRPIISGQLESPVTAQKDWAPIFQTDQRYKPANEPPKPPGQYFSDKAIDVSVMKALDVDLRYEVKRYLGEKMGKAIQGWDATIRMTNGDLKIEPVSFVVGSGRIGGRLHVDGRKLPLDVQIELGAKRVNLTRLLAPASKEIPVFDLKPSEMARGYMTGQLDLTMKGKSPMELARSVRGPIEFAIEDGALSGTVIEAFGLDITQTISNWIRDHPIYDIQCALASFEAGAGVIKSKTFLIATPDTSIIGRGEVNLVGNKVDIVLTAHPHDFSIGSLRSPIEIKGPLNDIGVSLEREELLTRSGLAVALGTLVNPIAALVPLIETGLDEKGKCRSVVQELNRVSEKASRLSKGKTGRVTR